MDISINLSIDIHIHGNPDNHITTSSFYTASQVKGISVLMD